MTRRGFVPPPVWTTEELDRERLTAISNFRAQRMEEPLEVYLEEFDERLNRYEDLLEATVDLTRLSENAIEILSDERLLEAVRYLAGPPISEDDLKTLADVPSLAPTRIKADPSIAKRLIDTVLLGLDRRRFPWVEGQREPTDEERQSAILASAALIATQRAGTVRRNESKTAQEQFVRQSLLANELQEVERRTVRTLADAPGPGKFCMESELGNRKADLLVGLWDGRCMPIECKVSNSGTNSIKRLNNDASVKAEMWRKDFGKDQVVPTAVLSGVYNLYNLEDAQQRGLLLFWAHDLVRMLVWIQSTRR